MEVCWLKILHRSIYKTGILYFCSAYIFIYDPGGGRTFSYWIYSGVSAKQELSRTNYIPVSYTHLDVYKRQDWDFVSDPGKSLRKRACRDFCGTEEDRKK